MIARGRRGTADRYATGGDRRGRYAALATPIGTVRLTSCSVARWPACRPGSPARGPVAHASTEWAADPQPATADRLAAALVGSRVDVGAGRTLAEPSPSARAGLSFGRTVAERCRVPGHRHGVNPRSAGPGLTHALARVGVAAAVVMASLAARSSSSPTLGVTHATAVIVAITASRCGRARGPRRRCVCRQLGGAVAIDVSMNRLPAMWQLHPFECQRYRLGGNNKKLVVRYDLLNFLDGASHSKNYSTRAVAATYCVAAQNDPKIYTDFYSGLFASSFQPLEQGPEDRTDSELAQLAKSVGADASVISCIKSGADLGAAATKAANGNTTLNGFHHSGTPLVWDGNKSVDLNDPGWLTKLVG